MFEGDLEDGELEIGQSSALIDEITVEQVFQKLLKEFEEADYSKF
jgi:enoyl-[acyl-carrier protein] reductase II